MLTSLPFHPIQTRMKSVHAGISYFCPYTSFQLPFFISLNIPLFQYLFFFKGESHLYTHFSIKRSRRHLLLLCYTAKDEEKGHTLLPLDVRSFGLALFHKVPRLLIVSTYALHVSALSAFSCTFQISAVHMF